MDNDKLFNDIEAFINKPQEQEDILTDKEVERIIFSVLTANGGSAAEDDIVKCVDWAQKARMSGELLRLVLDGYIDITWDNEENDAAFKITPQGTQAVDRHTKPN